MGGTMQLLGGRGDSSDAHAFSVNDPFKAKENMSSQSKPQSPSGWPDDDSDNDPDGIPF